MGEGGVGPKKNDIKNRWASLFTLCTLRDIYTKVKRHENITYRVDGLAGGGGDELHPDLLERGGGAGPVSSQPSPPNSQQLKLGCHTIPIKLGP